LSATSSEPRIFCAKVLGFELKTDAPLYPGATARWVAVAPAGAATEIILYRPDKNWAHYEQVVGKAQSITLDVSDLAAVYEELKGKGVTLVQEPDVQPWGTFATLQDSEGNLILFFLDGRGDRFHVHRPDGRSA
jgi:hypothetical protein